MNRQTLITLCLCIPLAVSVLGMLTNINMLSAVNGWLHRPGAEQQAHASALRPLIDCINRVDSPWRLAYLNYRTRSPEANDTSKAFIDRFPELYQRRKGPQLSTLDNETRRPDRCLLTTSQKTDLREDNPRLADLHERYVRALLEVNSATQLFDFYPAWDARSSTAAQRAERDVSFVPLVEGFLVISSQLRQEVEDADRRNRPLQLQQLRDRGKLHAAFVPDLIVKSRDAMTRLSDGVAAQTLDPQTLAQITKALKSAWGKGENTVGADDVSQELQTLWKRVKPPADDYLQALDVLNEHWASNAPPQQLSDDFGRAQRRYDLLIDGYNQAVGQTY